MDDNVRCSRDGAIGVIELNRPHALNSLTPDMITAIASALEEWERDDSIRSIALRSTSSKAFCAGGDVRWVRGSDAASGYAPGDQFFEDEYRLNLRLATFPKPITAHIDGIVMGGGLGLAAHVPHRHITPRALAAMPECAIGFIPDVGMSYVLTHLTMEEDNHDDARSGEGGTRSLPMGLFLGVTGYRQTPADMLFTGLATDCVGSPEERDQLGPLFLKQHAAAIDELFRGEEWSEIEERLNSAPANQEEQDVQEYCAAALQQANPTSVVATFELLRRSAKTDLPTALANELMLAKALRREPNFSEGVRAVLVDKDHAPQFFPPSTEDVDGQRWRQFLK